MLGATLGSVVFFCAALDPRREFAAEVGGGGGDFSRGDRGHCGVVSPDPAPRPFGARGRRDTASETGPDGSCGTLAADNARWMAAAEGWVEMGVERGPVRLSLRIGEVLRDV